MDKKNEKKFIQSPVAIICYVLAALMLIYACYQGGSTVNQINEYYAGYGMSAKPTEYVMYVFQAMLEPVFHAIVIFMVGYILTAVRKLDPKNYKTVAEIADMEEAKKEAREKKQVAKGDAKAAMAGRKVSKEDSVRADFSESLDAELKADAKATKSTSRKSGQSKSKSTQSKSGSKTGTGKSGESKSGSKTGTGKSGESKSGSKSGSGTRKSSSKSGSSKSRTQAPKKSETKTEDKIENKAEEKIENKIDSKPEEQSTFSAEVKNDVAESIDKIENEATAKMD